MGAINMDSITIISTNRGCIYMVHIFECEPIWLDFRTHVYMPTTTDVYMPYDDY